MAMTMHQGNHVGIKRIAILGAGFAGMRAANVLARKLRTYNLNLTHRVVLIDKSRYQTYTPLLYEVATTSKETANATALHEVATYDIESLIDRRAVEFKHGEVCGIDLGSGELRFVDGSALSASYLIIALGTQANFFNIRGLEEHATPLKSFLDAIEIRDAIWSRAMDRSGPIRVIVGGGGSTGVELAGELRMLKSELAAEFPGCKLDVRLIEAEETILHGFSAVVIRRARGRLEKLGVELLERERIASVTKENVNLESGRAIPYDVLVWTGGISPSELVARIPVRRGLDGRIIVNEYLLSTPQIAESIVLERIYAVGDVTLIADPATKGSAEQVAPAAIAAAEAAAHNIIEDIKREVGVTQNPKRLRYVPVEYPYIIPIGGKYALAKIGPILFTGFLGWTIKGLVELRYLLSIMPSRRALALWFRGLYLFVQNERLG